MTLFRHAILFTLLTTNGMFAQALDNKVLSGKYYARHLMVITDTNGSITDARTFYGVLTFDGKGAYAYQGSQLVGALSPAAASGSWSGTGRMPGAASRVSPVSRT